MNKIFLSLYFISALVYSPGAASAEESLLVNTIRGHSRIVHAVAFSPDGKYLASGGADNALRIWNAEDGSLVKTLKGHASFVNSAAFSPDGKSLLSSGGDGQAKLWDLESGYCVSTLRADKDSVWSAVFFPDGKSLATGGADGIIRLWKTGSKNPYKKIRAHAGYINTLSVSPDGKYLASGSASENNVKVWNAETGAAKATLEGHHGAINSLAFSKSGEQLISGSEDGTVKLWRVKDSLCVKTFSQGAPVFSVAYSPDDAYIFSGGRDNRIDVWIPSKDTPVKVYSGHNGQVRAVAVSPDGKYLASGSYDKTIKIWLTPWEADRRINEVKEAAEKDKNYEQHYKAGIQLLDSPTIANLKQANLEFTTALSFKQEKECSDKLNEVAAALKKKEEERRAMAILALKGLLAAGVLLIILRLVSNKRGKAKALKNLPDEIKRQTMTGNYDKALDLYKEYKSFKGDMEKLPKTELKDLYQSLRIPEELSREDLPYHFLLSYSSAYAKDGNYRLAANLLRSGKLADDFKKPEDFDAFAEIYSQIYRTENLLMVKLKSSAYSGLAEAFRRAGNFGACEKVCALKKQHYPAELTPRDLELLAECRKNAAQPE